MSLERCAEDTLTEAAWEGNLGVVFRDNDQEYRIRWKSVSELERQLSMLWSRANCVRTDGVLKESGEGVIS